MTEFSEGFRLDLSYSLSRYVKFFADFFERSRFSVVDTVTESQHLFFAGRERIEYVYKLSILPATTSVGAALCSSSIKSPKWLSSSSPIGVSSDTGS